MKDEKTKKSDIYTRFDFDERKNIFFHRIYMDTHILFDTFFYSSQKKCFGFDTANELYIDINIDL